MQPWEVESTLPRLKLELATRSPATAALELLHQAAFRWVAVSKYFLLLVKYFSLVGFKIIFFLLQIWPGPEPVLP